MNQFQAGGGATATTRHVKPKHPRAPRPTVDDKTPSSTTRGQILEAAYRTLVTGGYNHISMRKIAEAAGVNQSLLHYYYGTKENLMLEVLEYINERLLVRQRAMYAEAGKFEKIWATSLKFFEEDVQSGYVRALWELLAQGFSDKRIAQRLATIIGGWRDLVAGLAKQALVEYGIKGRYDPIVLGRLMGDLYFGAEAEILAGEDPRIHIEAIRVLGNLFRWLALDERESAGQIHAKGGAR
ncbi:MAG TPA: TetR/AcrR family transcriptional regulator [bacterium]|nr:TetR/AcrR family transcriptional regulator [bacterium]